MDEKNNDENAKVETNNENEELGDETSKDDVYQEPEYVTREINLDDLYDGAVNNTVVIDPVTNDEILLSSKKPNYTIVGIIIAVAVLLILYFINNKTDIGRATKPVAPKTTTTTTIPVAQEKKSGTITCTYASKSDAESQSVTLVANYEEDVLKSSKFNYSVVASTDVTSAVITDLTAQYENFFINNASVPGNSVTFDKNDKGFTFNVETDYKNADFTRVVITEGQTILYVKPDASDTPESLQEKYSNKGFTCAVTDKELSE